MAKKPQQQLDAELREKGLRTLIEALSKYDSELELLPIGNGSFVIPVLDEEKYERYAKITIEIPTGERDGEPYDAYAEAEEYAWLNKDK